MSDYFIEPFVDTGLGSHETKKGILIDPLRDVDRYLNAASELGLTLTHILDIHLHADFVSGNRETARQTGAVIGASENRSMSATSVLKRRGYRNVIQAEGGINKWRMHGFEVFRDNSG